MSSQDLVVSQQERTLQMRENFLPVFDIQSALARKQAMHDYIAKILTESTPAQSGDYGVIPGTNKQKVLLKPGAEKLCSFFGLSPRFVAEHIVEDWTGAEHGGEPLFYFRYKCELYRGTHLIAEAVGSCNSWEKKYRYRSSERVCPSCGKACIIKGKAEYGGGFLCFGKKGGCGAKFSDTDESITGQEVGNVKNPDVADVVNTCQKIAQKRALVAAVLIGTNASDSFTQDLEDVDVADQTTGKETPRAKETAKDEPVPEDPKLAALFAKLTSQKDREPTITDLCARLDELIGKDGTDKVWSGAAKGRDANSNLGVARAVTQALYEAINRAETPKAQAKPAVAPDRVAEIIDEEEAKAK
jgi:hypothetical protein